MVMMGLLYSCIITRDDTIDNERVVSKAQCKHGIIMQLDHHKNDMIDDTTRQCVLSVIMKDLSKCLLYII